MNKYKVLAFDLDDTLIDDTKARKYAIEKVVEKFEIPHDKSIGEAYVKFDDDYWRKNYSREIHIPTNILEDDATYLRSIRFIQFFDSFPLTYEEALQIYYFYRDCLEDCVFPFDGVYETLQELSKYFKIVIATNGVKKIIHKKLEIIKIKPFISDIICSEDFHCDKPHIDFFNHIVTVCNCDRKNILYIGNSLTSDIQGGMNSGLDTCWFNPNHLPLPSEYSPTYEINHMLELTKKLAA